MNDDVIDQVVQELVAVAVSTLSESGWLDAGDLNAKILAAADEHWGGVYPDRGERASWTISELVIQVVIDEVTDRVSSAVDGAVAEMGVPR